MNEMRKGIIRSDQHRIIGLDALWDLIVQNPNYSASLHNRQLIDVLVNSQKEDARQASALKKERIRFHEKEKRQEVIAAGHQSLTPKKNDPSCLMDGESKETNPPNHRFVRCSQTSSSEAITFSGEETSIATLQTNGGTPACTNLMELTGKAVRRRVASKEFSPMNANPPKKSPATVTSEAQELEHQIRLRAHELYEARGREDGHELEDWLRAEEEIAGRKVRAAIA